MGVLETIVVVAIVSAMAALVVWKLWRAATAREKLCGRCPGPGREGPREES